MGSEWLDYDYKLSWNLKGGTDNIHFPTSKDKWLSSNEASIALNPPFIKKLIQVDADRSIFKEENVNSCTVRFFVILNGEPKSQKMLILRAGDVENTSKLNLYCDKDEPIVYQVTWYIGNEQKQQQALPLEGDYIFLMPPQE